MLSICLHRRTYLDLPLTNQSLCQSRGPTIECPAVWRNSWACGYSPTTTSECYKGRFVQSSIIQGSLWDCKFDRLPKQMHLCIQIGSSFEKVKCLFIVLNRRICFILFYRVSAHKNGARAGKEKYFPHLQTGDENVFLTYL